MDGRISYDRVSMEVMVYTNHWKTIEIKEPQLWH